jgi:hypothetical protein
MGSGMVKKEWCKHREKEIKKDWQFGSRDGGEDVESCAGLEASSSESWLPSTRLHGATTQINQNPNYHFCENKIFIHNTNMLCQ